MNGRILIDFARTRAQAVVVQAAKRSKAHLSERLRLLAERAGLKNDLGDSGLDGVSGHSLRRGYITTAALLGRGPLEIQSQSRHKDVNVLAKYVESVARQTADVLVAVDDLVA